MVFDACGTVDLMVSNVVYHVFNEIRNVKGESYFHVVISYSIIIH